MKKLGLGVLLLIWSVALFGAGLRAGRGQVVARSASPDGNRIAEVRSRWTIDPPAHSLWLQRGFRQTPLHLTNLAEDQDWCDQIFWSPNGAQVAFLVRGVRLLVFDAATGEPFKDVPLVPVDGYPGSLEARSLTFSADGRSVSFSSCKRRSSRCVPRTASLL